MNCAHCRECGLVGDIMLSQKGTSQTHQSVLEISRNIGMRPPSVGHIIPWSFRKQPSRGKECAYLLANAFSGRVAIQVRWGEKLCMCYIHKTTSKHARYQITDKSQM